VKQHKGGNQYAGGAFKGLAVGLFGLLNQLEVAGPEVVLGQW
jgi:hypothetical protein